MPVWAWILLLLTLVKLPLAGLMLWLPIRYDESMRRAEEPLGADPSDEDGGSKALPAGPLDPHPRRPLPRWPRRGPHGSPSPTPPPRIRTAAANGRSLARQR